MQKHSKNVENLDTVSYLLILYPNNSTSAGFKFYHKLAVKLLFKVYKIIDSPISRSF